MAWKKMWSVVATTAAVMVCAGVLASCGTSGSAANTTVDTVLSASASTNGIDSASAVTATDDTSGTTGTDAMPSNPSQELPDSVDSSIPNNATVVSSDLAVTKDGAVKNLETGETVTDPEIVGTEDTPPDPLAKTNGQRFIPVSVKTVRNAIKEESNTKASALKSKTLSSAGASVMSAVLQSSTGASVKQAALQNNEYGAYWGSYGGTQAFFERGGALFAQNAKGVVDVSEHNGTIDWAKAKANGVQGVIIRLGFGWGNRLDYQAQRNISECKRLGIPFGIYWYSYAYEASQAAREAETLVSQLRQLGVSPSDLSYPVFYDLESGWTWSGHTPPTSTSVYQSIVNAWWQRVQAAGYSNLSVYSYASYLNGPLNTSDIHSKTHWAASYGAHVGFNFGAGLRGWQYWSSGSVPGISGPVDLNAFANEEPAGASPKSLGAVRIDIPEGNYYLMSAYSGKAMDIAWASTQNLAAAELWQYSGNNNQIFKIINAGNHQYYICAMHSGKVLDASGASFSNGTSIVQYSPNGGKNQLWEFYRNTDGSVYILSVLGGTKYRAIDITGSNSNNGAPMELWALSGKPNQRFWLVQENEYRVGANGWTFVNGARYWYANGVKAVSAAGFDPSTGRWYYFDSSGQPVSGWVNLSDGRRVYYDPATFSMVHGEKNIAGHWYYFDANSGNMAKNQDIWLSAGNKWVRYDSAGHMVYGENYFNHYWYYFNTYTGAMEKGWVYLPTGGKWVYYDPYWGRMLHGEANIGGNWYYFDTITGATAYGWKRLPDGREVYYHPQYGYMLKGWQTIDGKKYYFNPVTGALIR